MLQSTDVDRLGNKEGSWRNIASPWEGKIEEMLWVDWDWVGGGNMTSQGGVVRGRVLKVTTAKEYNFLVR